MNTYALLGTVFSVSLAASLLIGPWLRKKSQHWSTPPGVDPSHIPPCVNGRHIVTQPSPTLTLVIIPRGDEGLFPLTFDEGKQVAASSLPKNSERLTSTFTTEIPSVVPINMGHRR